MNKTLAEAKPKLASEWHPTKNFDLTPADVTVGSGKKVWWICSKGHEWDATIQHRNAGRGCPVCVGRKVINDNSLQTINPQLASEWHPTKNGIISPKDVTANSHKKVWWLCENKHEWIAAIADRNGRRTGCPYCAGHKVCHDNSLLTNNPQLASEWHPTKNTNLTPADITVGSGRKVWWICQKGHEWEAAISSRSKGHGCPYCTWQTSKLELRIITEIKALFQDANHRVKLFKHECDVYIPCLKLAVEIDGIYWHKEKTKNEFRKNLIFSTNGITLLRVREKGLRVLSETDIIFDKKESDIQILKKIISFILDSFQINNGKTLQLRKYLEENVYLDDKGYHHLLSILPNPLPGKSLLEINPSLSKEWHPQKNHSLTAANVPSNSHLNVWWVCSKGHEWYAKISNRNNGKGCPVCAGQKLHLENCLLTINPQLASEWHPIKNGILTPKDVLPSTDRKVWWLCSKGHEWQATLNTRNSNKSGCPICSGKKAHPDNCLLTINPELAREWRPHRNDPLKPTNVTANSNKKVWWVCQKGHEWMASISHRNQGQGCPICSGNKVTIDNCLQTVNPKLASEWHPYKNLPLTSVDITSRSNRKVWWICQKGHEWSATLYNRSKGSGCPMCAGLRVHPDNCLKTKSPQLASEWHPIKNANLTPMDVTRFSDKKVWWQCKNGHEWEATVHFRSIVSGCPICKCLQTVNPQLSSEWHPTKNGDLTPRDVKPGSDRKVWWVCKLGHEWVATINKRSIGRGCPHCWNLRRRNRNIAHLTH